MQTPSFEPFNDLYTAGCAALQQGEQESARLFQELARYQFEFIKLYCDLGNRQLTLLMSGKQPLEIFASQAEIAQEFVTRSTDLFRDAFTSTTNAVFGVMACFKSYVEPPGVGEATPEPTAARSDEAGIRSARKRGVAA